MAISVSPIWIGRSPYHGLEDGQRSRIASYAIVALLVAVAFGVTEYFQAFELRRPSLFLFFAAVVASTWLGGTGAGIFSATASIVAGLYFYNIDGQIVLGIDQLLMCGFFGCCIIAGTYLNTHQRQADLVLRHAHSTLQTQAAELERINDALQAEMAERGRAEVALAKTQSELTRVSRLTVMGELAASIAHEINQPLAAIVTNAGSALHWLNANPPALDEVRHAAQCVIRDGSRAGEIIANIRNAVRKGLPEREQLDINNAISDVLSLMRHELSNRGIKAAIELDPKISFLYGDRVQLQQALLNILINAMEALDGTDVTAREIRIASKKSGDNVQVSIEDSGPGFARDRASPFEAFYTTKANGTGIGLSICRSIVEAHGGSLSATSIDPHGARLSFTLPLHGEQI